MITLHLFFNGSGLRIIDSPHLNETEPEAECQVYFTNNSELPHEWVQYFQNLRHNSRLFNRNTKAIFPLPGVLLKYKTWLRNFCLSCGLPALFNAESDLFVVPAGNNDTRRFWKMRTEFYVTMIHSLN